MVVSACIHNGHTSINIEQPSQLAGMYALPVGVTLRDVHDGRLTMEDLPGKLRMYFGTICKQLRA